MCGVDGAAQQRGVEHVGQQVRVAEQLAAVHRLAAALVVEVDVDPARELVLGVPLALAVAEEDELVGRCVRHWADSEADGVPAGAGTPVPLSRSVYSQSAVTIG